MITINLEFSKWPEMFKDATLVAALVDCLTYHSHFLNMNANRIASKMRAKGSRSFYGQSGSEIYGRMAHFFIGIRSALKIQGAGLNPWIHYREPSDNLY